MIALLFLKIRVSIFLLYTGNFIKVLVHLVHEIGAVLYNTCLQLRW
jgi:hypothetical protein